MRTPERDSWRTGDGDDRQGGVPLDRADPAAVIQRALGGFPAGEVSAEQIVLAWLMTLPPDVDPPLAARAILAGRLPCCRTVRSPIIREVRDLLRFVASHRRLRVVGTDGGA
jgi:hypothetical protein